MNFRIQKKEVFISYCNNFSFQQCLHFSTASPTDICIVFLDYYYQLQINSRMIKQQNYDDRTIKFIVNIQNRSPSSLLLTIRDYQRQFRQFVFTNGLTKPQALQLKLQIENTLRQQMRLLKQSKQAPVQEEQKPHHNSAMPRYRQDVQQHVEQESKIVNMPKTITKQFGTQIEQFRESSPKIQDVQKQRDSIKFDQQGNVQSQQNISFGEHSIRKEDRSENNYFQIQTVIQKSLQLQESAKFNQVVPNEKLQISQSDFGEEQGPKPFPFNLPQSKVQYFQKIEKPKENNYNRESTSHHTGDYHFDENQEKYKKQSNSLLEGIKKKLFLEDLRNPEEKSLKKPKNGNPQIFNRLYKVQTQSFKNKQFQERNLKQEFEFDQVQDYFLQKPMSNIQSFQNLSKKTTQSFEAKHKPESNWAEEKQKAEYEKSFKQHLKKKEKEKEMREKGIKEKSGQKKLQLKGSHCQCKQIIKKLKKMEQQKQQKEKKIKQRMKLSPAKDLSKKSFSPASKSRQCAVCSPGKKQKRKENLKANRKDMVRNKEYVSHILSQSYKEFCSEMKNNK